MVKFNYTPEQRKKVKNLSVSANILKSEIKELQAKLDEGGLNETDAKAIQDKIAYKQDRMEKKQAEAAEIKASVEKVPVVRKAKETTESADAQPAPTEASEEF